MHSNASGGRCPVCGQDYATLVVLERPVDWRDVYRGRPVDFFEEYDRRCSAGYDVESDAPVAHRAVAVYFHDERRDHSLI